MARSMKSVPEDLLRQLAEEIRVCRQESERGPAAVDDATLAAYAAGTLDEPERKRVEEQLAGSPELAEMVAAVRETLEQGDWRSESPDLAPKLRLPLVLGPDAPPVGAQRRLPKVWRVRRWAAAVGLASSFLLGMGAGVALFGNSVRDFFRVSTERLGGDDTSKLDASITSSAKGQARQGLADLKDQKDLKNSASQSNLKE